MDLAEIFRVFSLELDIRYCLDIIKLLLSFGAKIQTTQPYNSLFLTQTCNNEIIHLLLDSIPEVEGLIQGEKGDELCYDMDSRYPKKVIILNWKNNRKLFYQIDSELYDLFRKDS